MLIVEAQLYCKNVQINDAETAFCFVKSFTIYKPFLPGNCLVDSADTIQSTEHGKTILDQFYGNSEGSDQHMHPFIPFHCLVSAVCMGPTVGKRIIDSDQLSGPASCSCWLAVSLLFVYTILYLPEVFGQTVLTNQCRLFATLTVFRHISR